jgi:hypothetical protein
MNQLHRGFQVRHYKPWKMWLKTGVVLVLLGVFFGLGREYQSYELQRAQLELETLLSRISELEARNHNLVQKNAHLDGSSRIEHDAYLLANQNLVKLQRELLAEKEELVFYQGIVSPKNTAFGINLQSFEVKKKINRNQHNYKLVLTKRGESNRKLRGSVRVTIRGEDDGKMREMNIKDIKLDNPGKAIKFEFKYFQVLQGDIEFPEKFTPYEVEININSTTKKVKSITETISWARLLPEDL